MRTDLTLHIDTDCTARFVKDAAGAWFKVQDAKGTDLSVFLPGRIPAEKVQTIVDAINDALDTVRPAQNEAA